VVESEQRHHHGTESVRLAQRHMQLDRRRGGLGGEHPGTTAQHATALGAAARQHSRVVGEENDRQVEGIGHQDEVRCLVGGIGVDGPGQYLRLVGHDGDGMPAKVCQRADDRLAERRLHLKPVRTVENDVEHRAHVVHPAVVPGDNVQQFGRGSALGRLVRFHRRRV
jgi:hypothetical protein